MAMNKDELFTRLKEVLVSDFDIEESAVTLDARVRR